MAGGKRAVGRQAVDRQCAGRRFAARVRIRLGGRRAEQRVDRYCSRCDSRRGSAVAVAIGVSS